MLMWGNALVLKHTCRKCPENQHRLGLLNQVPITTSSLPPVRTGARRAQMVVLNLGHDGVPRGLSPFCSQLSRYLRVAMMMPFICSYRNKKAQLSSFLRVACGRQKVSWWPIGASIVATSIPASRRLRVTVGAAWTGELQKQQIVVNFQGCVFKFVTVFIQRTHLQSETPRL